MNSLYPGEGSVLAKLGTGSTAHSLGDTHWDKPHKIRYGSRRNMCVSNNSQGCCEWLWSVIIVARRTDKILWLCPFCYELAQLFPKRVASPAVLGERAGLSRSCLQREQSASRGFVCRWEHWIHARIGGGLTLPCLLKPLKTSWCLACVQAGKLPQPCDSLVFAALPKEQAASLGWEQRTLPFFTFSITVVCWKIVAESYW